MPVRIYEISGYLCLTPECRRDESGVPWPPHYDAYLADVDALRAAGVHLNVSDAFDGSARNLTRRAMTNRDLSGRPRSVEELTDDERQELADAYLFGERLKTVYDRLMVQPKDARRYCRELGLPPRQSRG